MRAISITGPGHITLRSVALPLPGPGMVRIRLDGSGVCASNLTPWSGPDWMHFPTDPGALGHEGWGVIDALGAGVTGLRCGERVASLGQAAYAEYDVAAEDAVVPLPADLDDMPFPGEALGCAMNIFDRSGIAAGQTVAIVGIGFLGALLTQLATAAGARVVAVSRRDESCRLALSSGAIAALALGPDHGTIVGELERLTDGARCPVVIEATGRQDMLDLATRLTAERGRLVIAGYHQDGPRTVDMWLWNWRGLDVVNAHERDPKRYVAGMRAAVAAVLDGRIDPRPLLTHTYPLERLDQALNDARDRPPGFVKALVLCR